MNGRTFVITAPTYDLTIASGSFPKAKICGTRILTFQFEIIFANSLKFFTASIFTSTSESFNKFPKVWIRLISVTYFPKFDAMAVKFLDKQSLTLHDLSSAAWIINGIMKVLF